MDDKKCSKYLIFAYLVTLNNVNQLQRSEFFIWWDIWVGKFRLKSFMNSTNLSYMCVCHFNRSRGGIFFTKMQFYDIFVFLFPKRSKYLSWVGGKSLSFLPLLYIEQTGPKARKQGPLAPRGWGNPTWIDPRAVGQTLSNSLILISFRV